MNKAELKERIKKGEQASREELLRLFQSGESIYFDETTVHRANFKDIDMDSFEEFLLNYMDIKANESEMRNYLKNLHLINGDNNPTAAGILFFGKKPQFLPPSYRSLPPSYRGLTPFYGSLPTFLRCYDSFRTQFEHLPTGF